MAGRQARRKAFTITIVTSLLVLGYWYGFFDYEIKRVTSVAELSPEQLRDRGDFNALYDKTMKDIVGHKIVSVELKTCAGCKLNRLEGVRDWIKLEAPMWDNVVEVVYIDNLDPVIKLYDETKQNIASIPASTFKQNEITMLLKGVGLNPKN